MHTLRGMPKRLPCIPEGGWPRLWMGVSRPHWSSDFSRPDRVQVRYGPPLCIESVRRLSGSMPRQDQPAQDAAAPTGQGVHAGSSAPRIPVGTSHSQRVHTNHEAPATVFIGGASHAAGPVSLFQRRQDKEHPCAASVQVDQVPGPTRVQAEIFPGYMEAVPLHAGGAERPQRRPRWIRRDSWPGCGRRWGRRKTVHPAPVPFRLCPTTALRPLQLRRLTCWRLRRPLAVGMSTAAPTLRTQCLISLNWPWP